MNRFFRRLKRFGKRQSVIPGRVPQDVESTRAKSTRHKKVTADHWNQ